MKIEFNRVNTLSKIASAVVLLGALPILVFYIGREYQQTISVYDQENSGAVQNFASNDYTFSVHESQSSQVVYNSGIEGVVLVGPTCPTQTQASTTDNCGNKPLSTIIKFVDQNGAPTTTVSAADGTFSMQLAPGDYSIVAGSGGLFPSLNPVSVTVDQDEYTKVNLLFDSGMR